MPRATYLPSPNSPDCSPMPRPTSSHEPSQLDRIEQQLKSLCKCNRAISGQIKLMFDTLYKNNTITRTFQLQRMASEEDLESFNTKLGINSTCMAEALCQLVHILFETSDVDNRLEIIFNLFFERDLVAKCSWTGRGFPDPKLCLSKYIDILSLIKYAGGNHLMMRTDEYVKQFIF
uniref:DUF4806 domain-containing protein n=1 Tax=Anopheles dirus TaxID=7168 RepID=A0A182NY77_9DIPT